MFHSCCCCGGGKSSPVSCFPCLPVDTWKWLIHPLMQRWCRTMRTVEKKGRTKVFTLMNEHLEVHGFLYSVRFNGACDLVTHNSKFSLSGPLKPNPYSGPRSPLQHCNTRRSPLQQSFPRGDRLSLLFLLFLLELLDGVHLSPGAHLAHRGRVLALHHQLVGHLVVFLQGRQTRKKCKHKSWMLLFK